MTGNRNLYFIDSRGNYRLLYADISRAECNMQIQKFLKAHDFTSYYTRTWETDKGTMFDVGSHTEFFLWGNKK